LSDWVLAMAVDTPKTVSIELAGVDQVDRVRELWLALHRHESDVSPEHRLVANEALSWQLRRALYVDRLSSETGFLALALSGESVVGYAFACFEDGPDDTFPVGDRYAELYSLSVAPSLRGHGIGTQLLDFVDRELARQSIHDLRVVVMAGNADAQRLYERRGLRVGELVMYRFGEAH
jgi:ribosomal protein S18 acetylase RimI-like enzyme